MSNFFIKAEGDARIGIAHIGLYAALVHLAQLQGSSGWVTVFGKEAMHISKISSSATYCKLIRELSDYGYLRYEPSYYKGKGSQIYIM